jgi:iron complex outermembrane receptor protein
MRLKVASTLAAVVGLLSYGLAQETSQPAPSAASATGDQTGGEELEHITVTGYIVPRVGDGPQPVISYDQNDINKSGLQTFADFLQNLPAAVGNFNPTVTTGFGFSPGSASIALKGLLPFDTLVLVDGLRWPQSALPQFGTPGSISFVDINQIPVAAIDRIDVLDDGGSAIYGSDAVAGVVNIILLDQYNGADLFNYYGISQRGDYETYHGSLKAGFTQELGKWGKLKVAGVFDYYNQGPIMAEDRAYSRLDEGHWSSNYPNKTTVSTNFGVFADSAGNTYQVNPGTREPITPASFTINSPMFVPDYNLKWHQIVPRETRIGGYAKITWELTDYLKFYDSFTAMRQEELSSFENQGYYGPSGRNNNGGIIVPPNGTVPGTNPFNPFPTSLIGFTNALSEFGPLVADTTITTYRNVVGMVLQLPHNWTINTSFTYGESDGTYVQRNMFLVSGLNAALGGTLPSRPGLFFDPFTDQTLHNGPNKAFYGAKGLTADIWLDNRTELASLDLTAGGTVVDLPSGPLAAAIGLEYRSETYIQSTDANSHGGNVAAFQNPIGELEHGRRYIKRIFGELDVPVFGDKWSFPGMRLLDATLSYTWDDYSDFGEAQKPKIALRYKPFNDLTIRASYSEGFVAPSLPQLFAAPVLSEAFFHDPLTNTNSTVILITKGNPLIKPETSYGYFLGVQWTPGSADREHSWWGWANGFAAYFNWFQINQHNVFATLSAADVAALGNKAPPGNGVIRNGPRVNGIPTVSAVVNSIANVGNSRPDGFEVGFTYKTKEFNWGKLDFDFSLSDIYHLTTLSIRPEPPIGKLRFQVLDRTDAANFVPDVKILASIFYSKTLFGTDQFRTGITLHWLDSEADFNNSAHGTDPNYISGVANAKYVHLIGNWTTLDWQISYTFGPAASVTLETPKPGYDKDGKRIVGEKAISPRKEGSGRGLRAWLDNTTFTVGINNIWDARPPLAVFNIEANFDNANANDIQRYFYVSVEKKF